jgi:hypothetical protein
MLPTELRGDEMLREMKKLLDRPRQYECYMGSELFPRRKPVKLHNLKSVLVTPYDRDHSRRVGSPSRTFFPSTTQWGQITQSCSRSFHVYVLHCLSMSPISRCVAWHLANVSIRGPVAS